MMLAGVAPCTVLPSPYLLFHGERKGGEGAPSPSPQPFLLLPRESGSGGNDKVASVSSDR